MKKNTMFLTLILCVFISFMMFPSLGMQNEQNGKPKFVLPAALILIEESAFDNTAADSVVLPDSLIAIGDLAFARNGYLREILIPESVRYIGENAFEEVTALTIRGAVNSYAASWACEHSIAFVPVNTVSASIKTLKKTMEAANYVLLSISCLCMDINLRRRRRLEYIEISMRPQDRIELYPINYRFP